MTEANLVDLFDLVFVKSEFELHRLRLDTLALPHVFIYEDDINGVADYSRQHYVPQFYLKHFSSSKNTSSKNTIFFYDKLKDKSFTRNIADIAQENSFYAIDEIERSAIEKALGRIEQIYFRNPYFELIRIKNFARFPHKSRKDFFIFLAVQLVRTNETRLELKEMHEQTLMAFAKGLWYKHT